LRATINIEARRGRGFFLKRV